MRFEWDERKNRLNLQKHGLRFETAALIFDDPFAVTQPDLGSENEERWITLGAIGPGRIAVVVFTVRERGDQEVIRVISARAALSHERKSYEEAHERPKTRYPRDRGEEG